MFPPRSFIVATALVGLCFTGCGSDSTDAPETFRAVQPVCVEDAPEDADWTCDEVLQVACEDIDDVDLPLVIQRPEGDCEGADFDDVLGPFAVGEHEISVADGDAGVVCSATLDVVDDEAPEVEAIGVSLWPPNHKMETVSVRDCIAVEDCDDDWHARIVSVSSDEPDNDRGDGNTDADVVALDAETVSLRSERQGGSNGRVYTISFEVEDGSGNLAEGQCQVVVTHDQSGDAAIDDGPAYVVEWPES